MKPTAISRVPFSNGSIPRLFWRDAEWRMGWLLEISHAKLSDGHAMALTRKTSGIDWTPSPTTLKSIGLLEPSELIERIR